MPPPAPGCERAYWLRYEADRAFSHHLSIRRRRLGPARRRRPRPQRPARRPDPALLRRPRSWNAAQPRGSPALASPPTPPRLTVRLELGISATAHSGEQSRGLRKVKHASIASSGQTKQHLLFTFQNNGLLVNDYNFQPPHQPNMLAASAGSQTTPLSCECMQIQKSLPRYYDLV
ncbi:uncharacterized protein LOC120687195 isoform X2 [Panicum virgatum]|uniref:uncharacterized protein LOC120687195 isoform X2 n=1 Tax=Panicum virgatum TaxID=38727 RepID=UPI0019D514C2|nr:uncharacterized protein LOC120687195 isoform X2 [Panicum virgatum]